MANFQGLTQFRYAAVAAARTSAESYYQVLRKEVEYIERSASQPPDSSLDDRLMWPVAELGIAAEYTGRTQEASLYYAWVASRLPAHGTAFRYKVNPDTDGTNPGEFKTVREAVIFADKIRPDDYPWLK